MHSTNFRKSLDEIVSFLTTESESVSGNLSEFGFRERIKIERCLFLMTKIICKEELNYDLQGFSKFHRQKLSYIISMQESDNAFAQIVIQIFQFKIFVQTLSNENAYVRGDALSKLGLDRKSVYKFIKDQVKSIVIKLNSLYVEPTGELERV